MKPWTRLRYWLRRPRLEADLAEEIRLHREMLEDEFVRESASPADARFAAQRRFGNSTAVAEQSRQEWSLVWIDALLHDLHFAWRLLVRQPMFAAAAILTVAFGVGRTTPVSSTTFKRLYTPAPAFSPPRWRTRSLSLMPVSVLSADFRSEIVRKGAGLYGTRRAFRLHPIISRRCVYLSCAAATWRRPIRQAPHSSV